MTRLELVTHVALDYMRQQIYDDDSGTTRLCMVGLDPSLVVPIASAVLSDPDLHRDVAVRIPSHFAQGGSLPASAVSDESITFWRHCRLPAGTRAVLFAASHEELQRNDKSLEKITRIETDRLRELTKRWMIRAGLSDVHLDRQTRVHLTAALQAVNETHVARTIEMFADFVLAIAESVISHGLPLQKAVDHALPALGLPRNAGRFDRLPTTKRAMRGEWGKVFRRLHTRVRPLVTRENEKGEPLTDQIRDKLNEVRPKLDDRTVAVIEAFLEADVSPDGWTVAQKHLTELDWNTISVLFEGTERRPAPPLGPRTIQFFHEEFDDPLDEDEHHLLNGPLPKRPTDEHEQFFEDRREQLARDKKLYSQWEKYVFHDPQTFADFFVGLIDTLYRLREGTGDDDLVTRKTIVRILNGRTKSFWRDKNSHVMRYFALRYRGLPNLFGTDVEFDFGKLSDFYLPEVDDELRGVTSGSLEARRLKFEVELDPAGVASKRLFYWQMPVAALAAAMADDVYRVACPKEDHSLLSTADITPQSISVKGQSQRLSLQDVTTIRDIHGDSNGTLVDPNGAASDCGQNFIKGLDDLRGRVLDVQSYNRICGAFARFADLYSCALRDWIGAAGISSDNFAKQAEAFGELLATLQECAHYDEARNRLWAEVLRIGIANVGGESPGAIITPWQPLRLAEIHVKALQCARFVKHLLRAREADFVHADILLGQTRDELGSIYYPEICAWIRTGRYELLAATETAFDYTLAEPPCHDADNRGGTSPDFSSRAAFRNLATRYLDLLPHEKTNFSVVLYNPESPSLPNAIAAEMATQVDGDTDMQCRLLLMHSQRKQLRQLYEQQNGAVNSEISSAMVSATSQSFLSRLRVGFVEPSAQEGPEGSRIGDLLLLHDVIGRNADVQWKPAPSAREPDLRTHVPHWWSRRRPTTVGEASATVYMTGPVQPAAGQAYINALQAFLRGDNALPGNVIPAREINFGHPEIKGVLAEAHRLGEWVVNFDTLVNRRILANHGLRVIHHIHDRSVDRNVVVSTTSTSPLLRALLKERINRIDPSIVQIHGDEVVDRLIADASSLSGQIVMRAARYGQFANELLGVVLSKQRLAASLGNSFPLIGWYFLDDFASWFGQREGHIADILAISPRFENGQPVLKMAFSEAKFVGSNGYQSQARKSAQQLAETVARVARTLSPRQQRIDRETWLHRIGDLMLEGMEPYRQQTVDQWDLHRWSDEVRQDNVPIVLAGFSHIFVHDDEAHVDAHGPNTLKGLEHCVQEVFDKAGVTAELKRFAQGRDDPRAGQPGVDDGWSSALNSKPGRPSHPQPTASTTRAAGGPRFAEVRGSSMGTAPNSDRPVETVATGTGAPEAGEIAVPSNEAPVQPPADDCDTSLEPTAERMSRWPSIALAEWVDGGHTTAETDEATQLWLEDTVRRLQRALRGYGMTAELVGKRLTPNAALVRFRGNDDLTVPKVERRRQELLTSHAVDVVNILPAPMEVVIMVRRPERAILHLRDLWRQRKLPESAPDENASLLLGAKESDGELLYLNVGDEFAGYQPHGPHTLIAGETGSGKGVLVQCLLLDICATNSPRNAEIRMIDPKAGIDFPWLRQMPHLHGDLVTVQSEAVTLLENLVIEMERRNRLLAGARATKLAQYNKRVPDSDRLPRIWLFHDELADWMLIDEYRKAVETSVVRLGVKARAAGINLVMVTQRPDNVALPMQLRANLSNRLVLKVADKRNSELVLDEAGAERLLGRGHLAAKLSGEGKSILTQVPFVTEDEIMDLADLIINARDFTGRHQPRES